MSYKVFSVAGEALHFGARRMETIMRVAWLPVTLLLVLEMATAFGVLSLANGRIIDFTDFPSGSSFQAISKYASQIMLQQIQAGSAPVALLLLVSLMLQMAIVASFMAPLTRLAGVGEIPARGMLRAPFGADQLRYVGGQIVSFPIACLLVLSPIWIGFQYILGLIDEALKKTYVDFPDVDSLHTIDFISPSDVLVARNQLWIYDFGVWMALAVGCFLVLWGLLTAHFRKPHGDILSLIWRGVAVFLFLALVQGVVGYLWTADKFSAGLASAPAANSILVCSVIGLLSYVALRFAAYPSVVVCRRSMALAGTFGVTRRWNLLRLIGVILLLGGILLGVQLLIEGVVFGSAFAVVSSLFSASTAYTQLINSGDAPDWLLPFFVGVWAFIRLLYKVFWVFFTYGVGAGVYGRLYRESES